MNLQSLPVPGPVLGPPSDSVDQVRRRIASRCERFAPSAPAAVDLAAAVIAAIAGQLRGSVSRLSGPRGARYVRGQFEGTRALPLEDLCRLAIEAPRALTAGLAVLARACGQRLVPSAPALKPVLLTIADLHSDTAAATGIALKALEDARLTAVEKRAVLARLDALARRVAEMSRAVEAHQ